VSSGGHPYVRADVRGLHWFGIEGIASRMATRITVKGQVTIPKSVRVALELAPGDGVEFEANATGQFVVSKAHPAATVPRGRRRERRVQPKDEAQMRRRAEELLALLRGLD
jgi:antitoxin PrlF